MVRLQADYSAGGDVHSATTLSGLDKRRSEQEVIPEGDRLHP